MTYLGNFPEDDTIRIPFSTHAAAGGAVDPSTAFENTDVKIYKNGLVAEKATANGVTMNSTFDSNTGAHLLEIDTSNDTGDVGFWAAGNDYFVVLAPDETVDGQTVVGIIGHFSIENRFNEANVAQWAGNNVGALVDTDKVPVSIQHLADSIITAAKIATDAIGADELAASGVDEIRDSILDRVLAGNHDSAGTLGKLAQNADAAVSTRSTPSQVATELSNYDSPTKAEMDDQFTAIKGAGWVAQSLVGITAYVDELESRLSATRAGYLDNLNVGGNVASQADVQGITQGQRVRVLPPPQMEKPDSGSTSFRVWVYAYNEKHEAEDLDSNPTITVENNAGTDRSVNLSAVTKPGATTGQYYADYTVADSHAIEALLFKVTATENAVAVVYAQPSHVVDTTAIDFTSADRAKLDTLHDTRLTAGRAALLDNMDVAVSTRATPAQVNSEVVTALNDYDSPTKAEMDAAISGLDAKIDAILLDTGTDGVAISAATMQSIATALLDLANGIETGITLRQAHRAYMSVLASKVSGADSNAPVFRDANDTKDRVTASTDSNGNRTDVTLDLN